MCWKNTREEIVEFRKKERMCRNLYRFLSLSRLLMMLQLQMKQIIMMMVGAVHLSLKSFRGLFVKNFNPVYTFTFHFRLLQPKLEQLNTQHYHYYLSLLRLLNKPHITFSSSLYIKRVKTILISPFVVVLLYMYPKLRCM